MLEWYLNDWQMTPDNNACERGNTVLCDGEKELGNVRLSCQSVEPKVRKFL
jgi:hypothetical protein